MSISSENMPQANLASGGIRTSYGLDNFSAAFNLFNRSQGLTSMTLGIGYNRAANFNSRSFIETSGERASIAQMFRNQMELITNSGIDERDVVLDNSDIYPDEFGTVMGWNSYLINKNNNTGRYTIPFPSPMDEPIRSRYGATTRGGLYEYLFSLGANVNNILYLGATLGAVQVNYRESISYEEFYRVGSLRSMSYDQSTDISGWGFSAKLGAILRPFPALRIGATIHLPTTFSIQQSYTSSMRAGEFYDPDIDLVDHHKFNSAPKLLAGASIIIGRSFILAADYELAWHNHIRLRGVSESTIESSRREANDFYAPAHSVRAGVEILASDEIALRLGGGYNFGFMRQSEDLVANDPILRDFYANSAILGGYTITGGLGFNIGRNGYLDITYLYNRTNYTDYELFYHDSTVPDETGQTGRYIVSQYDTVGGKDYDRAYTPIKNLHQITLTFGSKF
jgi:hypothetical protein